MSDGIYSNKAQSTWKNQALSGGVSAILQSGLIPKNIQRKFFVKIHVHCPGSPDWQQKHCSRELDQIIE